MYLGWRTGVTTLQMRRKTFFERVRERKRYDEIK